MEEFDIIVIGGGSAGCATAGRLAEHGGYSVCLIEAGGRNDDYFVKTPGMMPFIPQRSNYRYVTVAQKGLNDRIGYQPRGRGLGGSSAINAMVYIRGNQWDYDNWAAMGCHGWSYKDVLPYFRRSEHNDRHADAFHGQGGPLHVMDQHYANPGSNAFVEAAARLQLPLTDDFNGTHQEGFGLFQVTQKGGERWSAARAYLEGAKAAGKLHVKTGELVERIIIEEGRATGVAIKCGQTSEIMRARGAVILSAGAFGSPHILQLSGIGPALHLTEMGIDVLLDQPEVGSNLQDHIDYVATFKTASKDFIGDSPQGSWKMVKAIFEHSRKKTGIMTTPYAESGGFWKSSPDAVAPDVQYHFVPAMLANHGRETLKGHGFSCHACVLRPESKGTLRLASQNAAEAPLIDPNYLSDDRDIAVLRKGVRNMHRIFATAPLSDYQGTDIFPVALDNDAALDQAIRNRADTVYHPVGTCRMGSDAGAVVDTALRLNGIAGLYVADASIMPKIVSGNTNAPSIMIGERAADLVAGHLRI